MAIETASGVKQPVIGPQDHAQGPADAAVTLVEYADYACSWSGEAHVFVARARHQFGDGLRVVYRHFPMSTMRQYAQQAAEAAEAAGAQGRFWQMHDTLFTHQGELDDGHLVEYADGLGLDVTRFLRDMASHLHAERVREDMRSGRDLGVNGTPTFFINGARFDHSWYEVSLMQAIEHAAQLSA